MTHSDMVEKVDDWDGAAVLEGLGNEGAVALLK
jgi:hypothetical protein